MTVTAFNSALQAPQYARARNTPRKYEGEYLVSLFSNRVVFAAQIATDLAAVRAWAELTFYNVTIGSWSDVIEGQAVIISETNDITTGDFFRTRLVPTSSLFYPNESSQNFSPGAYIWVIDNYLPQYRLSRPSTNDPLTAEERVDYDQVYRAMLPMVIGVKSGYAGFVNPSTGKLRLGFDASQSEAAQNGATIASTNWSFQGDTVVAGALNESIVIVDLEYGEQWAACAVVDSGGRATTRRFGIKVHDPDLYPPDVSFEKVSISATLEQGYTCNLPAFANVDSVLSNTFAIVWRNAEAYSYDEGDLYQSGVWGDITNKQLTTSLATLTSVGHPFVTGQTIIIADVGAPFDGTFVIISTTVNTFSYACPAVDVASTPCSGMGIVNPINVDFVGWLMREDDPIQADMKYTVISKANFSFTGVGPRLARLVAQQLAFINSASPTRWGDITNLTPWRAIWHFLSRYTTITSLCDVSFDSTEDTYLFSAISSDGGNVLSAIQQIAQQIDANVEFAPWGAIAVKRDANFTHTGTAVSQWTASDFTEVKRDYDPNPNVGKVDGDGAFYNPTSSQVTDYTARAPGIAQGEAEGSDSYPARILAATTSTTQAVNELLQRAGDRFEFDNLRVFLDVTFRAGWIGAPLIPSRSQVSTITLEDDLAGDNGVNRVVYDTLTQWTIENASTEFDPERGIFTVRARLRQLTEVGDPADDTTVVLPAPGSIPDALPDPGLPAFDWELALVPESGLQLSEFPPAALLPSKTRVSTFKGQELLIWDDDQMALLRNFINLTTPQSAEVTPPDLGSFVLKQGAIDPFFNNYALPAYYGANDGTNSVVGWNPNIASPGATAAWQTGGSVDGTFNVLRTTKVQGAVMIYAPDASGGSVTQSINFRTTNGGFVAQPNYVGNSGQWVNTVGWKAIHNQVDMAGHLGCTLDIDLALGASTVITGATMTYDLSKGSGDLSGLNNGLALYSGGTGGTLVVSEYVASDEANGVGKTITLTPGSYNCDTVHIQLRSAYGTNPGDPIIDGSAILTGLTITATTSTGAQVAISFTFGGTFLTPVTVGDSPGSVAGFDVQRSGNNSFAAADGLVKRATTLGGAYSAYYTITGGAQARCIIIPYFNWAGAVQTSATNPDIIVALNQADGSSRTLLWITGGATPGTVHDITPVAGITFDNANCVTDLSGHHIAVFGLVSAVYKLYTTNNKGVAWVNRGTLSSPGFIRCRRNDGTGATSGTNRGQLYLAETGEGVVDWSSRWGDSSGPNADMWPRICPFAPTGLDTVF